MTAVLPEIDPQGRHRAPDDAPTGSMGVIPADRRTRSGHGRHGRPEGAPQATTAHPLSRAARTAGLSLAALGAVATAGGMATHGLIGGDEPPATGEQAISPQLASANLAIAPAAHDTAAATSSVLPVVNQGAPAGASSIKHDSPDSRAAAARTAQQSQERQAAASDRSDQKKKEPQASSAGSSVAQQAISAARGQLGVPYVWGGTTPDGFDCSGLTQFAFEKAGIELPRTSRAQAQEGQEVSADSMKPGDLIFFNSPVSHVGIYIGGGKMIEAPNSGSDVKISDVQRRMDDMNTIRRVG
ncbi:cell wall-associated NlpC family hydrolase [Actinomycetospora succinea]|uniref:Cell wall-associated NlpC family hydrolase n=1 Tax=Actinomycetospora succinea TaxID=663603 RepID=A0A4R6VSD9_9PSEU|nr:C40 family peptidase [Actinomycetospora succinea]TDQ65536.1 cell wall-associated NlpC family hydrolase [Actinomycetospora succinea]